MKPKKQISIIMGSESDYSIMVKAEECLKEFGIDFDTQIVSAHRTPDKMYKFAKEAHKKGIKVIIAGAGGAAHLPGMVASLSILPVIGVPIGNSALKGQDSLLSIVQMPKGVPVATVAIDNAYNAGLLALQILGTFDKKIEKKLLKYRSKLKLKIEKQKLK